MIMKNFYVYVYMDPRKPGSYSYDEYHFDYKPFYIGKGKDDRWKGHLYKSSLKSKTYKNYKIKKILSEGYDLKNYIIKIEEKLTEKMAFNLEMKLISIIGFDNLTNLTNGGEGISGCIPWNKGKKQKFNKRYYSKICKWCNNDFMGTSSKQNFCLKCKEKINYIYINKLKNLIKEKRYKNVSDSSKRQKGKKLSEEHKKKLSEAKIGKKLSEEHKNNVSKGIIKNWIKRKEKCNK